MKRLLPLIGLLAVPTIALALDFTDSATKYIDAPFPRPVAAGISVLTNVGAVQGNPNGAFDADRAINRAEFLKIVLISSGTVDNGSGRDCFPDVHAKDWFSVLVCGAKDRGIVKGNPDGLYHPERPVNYAEALAMLVRLYRYDLTPQAGDEWYMEYARAAADHKTALPISITYDTPLTRGQMARLAAGFLAEHEGVLSEYRALEVGSRVHSSSSTSSMHSGSGSSRMSSGSGTTASAKSSSVSSSSSSFSSSLSSSSSSSSPSVWFPAQSRIIMVGQKSLPLIDNTFVSNGEDSILRTVQFKLRNEVRALQSLILVDAKGTEIATLVPETDSNVDHRKWKADILGDNAYRFPKDTPVMLGLVGVFNTGVSHESFERESFAIRGLRTGTNQIEYLSQSNEHAPISLTANGKVIAVRNTGSGSAITQKGLQKLLGTFSLAAQMNTGATVTIQSVTAVVLATDVSVTHVRIGGSTEAQQADCSIDRTDVLTITCPVIPASLATITKGPISLSLYGDLDLRSGATNGTIQITLPGTGGIGQFGAITWNDQTANYYWMEAGSPLEAGTKWTVKP